MSSRNICPRTTESGQVGKSLKRWLWGFFKYLNIKCYIDLSTMAPPAYQEGRIFWDEDEHTVAIYNENSQVKHDLGQETLVRIYNVSGSEMPDGVAVKVVGVNGEVPEVDLAQADTIANANVLAVTTTTIPNNDFGYATIVGIIHDLDTSAFSEGDKLFVSDSVAGELTNTPAPIEAFVGFVLKVHATEGTIFVHPQAAKQNTGDMLKSVYDTNDDGIVDMARSQSHYYTESEGESSTTATALQTKDTLTFTPTTTGDYIIEWYFEINSSATNRRIPCQVDVDDATVIAGLLEEESPLGAYPLGWKPVSGFKKVNLTNVSHSIRIKYATETGTATAYIRNARIVARRVH